MKFICSSSALLRQLRQVATVIPKKSLLPSVERVLFTVSRKKGLVLTGTDLEHFCQCSLPVEYTLGQRDEADEITSFSVLPQPLLEVLANTPDQPIVVWADMDHLRLTINVEALEAGLAAGERGNNNGKYKLALESGGDFPKPPTKALAGRLVSLPGHLLRTALAYTSKATSTDFLRPAMCGVHFVFTADKLVVDATNGHYMAQYTVEAKKEPGYDCHGGRLEVILPKLAIEALTTLVKSDDTISFYITETGLLQIEVGTFGPLLHVKLGPDKFPDTSAIIPAVFPGGVLTLNRLAMLSMLKRLKPFTSRATHALSFVLSPAQRHAIGQNLDDDLEATESLPGTFETEQENQLDIAFNIQFLSLLVGLVPGPRVRMHFTGALSKAVVITSDGSAETLRFLLMPVMVNNYM